MPRGRALLPWSSWLLALALAGLSMVLSWDNLFPASGDVWSNFALVCGYPLAGAIILGHRPGHPIGRLMCAIGVASGLALAVHQYAIRAVVLDPGSLPFGRGAAWLGSWLWTFGVMPSATLLPLLFPDGRLPTRRARVVAGMAASAIVGMSLGIILKPGRLEDFPSQYNPTGVDAFHGVAGALQGIAFPLFVLAVVGTGAVLVGRWRGADDVTRHQLRWFTASVVALVLVAVLDSADVLGRGPAGLVVFAAFLLPPFAIVAAVLRYQLYGIDLIVNRSLVYAALTGTSFGLYLAVVHVVGTFAGSLAGSVAATAAVAVAFQPARIGVQRAIDRVLHGDRAAPDVALRRITERLAEVGASSELLAVSARAVAESLGANGVVVSAWSDPAPESATWGQMVGEESRFPLEYETAVVGELVVASDAAARLDQLVVRRLLGPVAIAAFVVKLTADIRRSRETAVLAREEERRRIRRDLHDGLGPELAGLALGLEGAADLVSRDPDAAGSALAALHEQVGAVIGEVRSLVYGLRPPILDDLGLLAAVRERAAALEASGVAVRLDLPGSIPGLPAAVELSLYRIATEALANIGRHARARTCRLHLEVEDAARLCVEDDGVGLNGARGVGLTAMHERAVELGGSCTVERLADGGTRVSASIPIYA